MDQNDEENKFFLHSGQFSLSDSVFSAPWTVHTVRTRYFSTLDKPLCQNLFLKIMIIIYTNCGWTAARQTMWALVRSFGIWYKDTVSAPVFLYYNFLYLILNLNN